MPTVTIPLTTVSVQSAKPNSRYGSPASMPVSPTAWMLARPSLASIPAGAVVSQALIQYWQYGSSATGSITETVKACTTGFSTASTWNTRPTVTTTNQGSSTRTAPGGATQWSTDITAMFQSWVSGSLANNGVAIATTSTTAGKLRGQAASILPPVMVVTYAVAPLAPTALNPTGGSVSIAKPTLTFQVPSDTLSIRVQIDPAANGVSPAFDSGVVASPGAGLLDLTMTAYAGLSNGSTTQWRALAVNSLGIGAWSAWVSFSRTTWGTLAMTSPGATSEDPSPTVQSTYTGTVTSWNAITRDASGSLVDTSGWTPGASMSFGTSKSVGAAGTAYMQIRDDVIRVATPGDPDYLQVSQAFTVVPSGVPATLLSLTVTRDRVRPWVTLQAVRSAIPDYVAIYRDDVLVDRVAGADCFTGTAFLYVDHTAPMGVRVTYTVYAIVGTTWSLVSDFASLVTRCVGIWLLNLDDQTEAVLWNPDYGTQAQPEVAVLHRPLTGNQQVVRRRLARFPREGVIPGLIADGVGLDALVSEANLRAWAELDAGTLYRLVYGGQNDQVIIGDIEFDETPLNKAEDRAVQVSVAWWVQG